MSPRKDFGVRRKREHSGVAFCEEGCAQLAPKPIRGPRQKYPSKARSQISGENENFENKPGKSGKSGGIALPSRTSR
jgi:hypothetical protein